MRRRHPEPVEMVEYARGRLDADEARELREHCEACADCGSQLAAVLLLRQGREAREVSRRWWTAAAAAAILVVGLGAGAHWLGVWPGGESGSGADPSAPTGFAADAEESAGDGELTDLASRRVPEGFYFTFDMVLGRYGGVPAAAGSQPVVPVLREALAAMKRGHHDRAIELLTPCCGGQRFHKWGTLLLGVALLADGQDLDRAAMALQQVVEIRPETEGRSAIWYLANVRLIQERPREALGLLRMLGPDDPAAQEAADLIPRIEERLTADATR